MAWDAAPRIGAPIHPAGTGLRWMSNSFNE